MPLGRQSYIIECQASVSYTVSVAPCVDIAGAYYQPVVTSAYVIESASMSYFEGLAVDFDYTLAGQYMAFAFTGVFVMWSFGIMCGRIIKAMWE